MKVLLDECAPRALKSFLSAHGYESRTVQDAGWSGRTNGELLRLAENDFDVLITVDANLRYQQNLAGRQIAILSFARAVKSLERPQSALSGNCDGTSNGQTWGDRLRGYCALVC